MAKTCCCGMSLNTATLIIGVLSAIISVLSCIVWTLALILVTVTVSQANVDLGPIHSIYIFVVISCSFSILFAVTQFAMTIVLIRGAQQENLKKVRIYLIYGTITIVLSVISAVVIGMVFFSMVSVVVHVFFLVVIWSYYKELKAKETNAGGIIYAPPPTGYPQPGYGPPQPGYGLPPAEFAPLPPGYGPPPPVYALDPSGYAPPTTPPLEPKKNADILKV